MDEFQAKDLTPVSSADIADAALQLKCEVAAIEAVAEIESNHAGFTNGKPTLLFESHQFHKLTYGQWDGVHPDISTPTWVYNYGPAGDHQYERLAEAMQVSRAAALQSASWGKFQIMGSNYEAAGYDNVEAFVADMCESEAHQLDAFVCFLQNTGADADLQAKDWMRFARSYNGPGQVWQYAQRLSQAYARHR
jgi:N-acetylmuramidase-like protein